jgi:plastocyanin
MLRRKVSRLLAGAAVGALVALPLAPAVVTAAPAALPTVQAPALAAAEEAAADQVLTFTGDNSVTAYASAPATATAGPATIVFENSAATGNNIGMSHTLTFDTSTPGYNHDVTLDILANPFDANGGRYEAEVNLTPGKYRYFCAIPGHGTMAGELVVTDAPADDTTAPTVTADVAGQQDADGAYIGTATVALTAEDAESGVASVEYSVNGGAYQAYTEPFVLDQPGMYMVETRATDNAGNVSTPEMLHIEVVSADGEDTTAPSVNAEVTGELDSSGAYIASATVTIAAQDAGSGVASIEYALDGGEYAPYTDPVVVDTAGEHTVTYRATDVAGNVSAEGSATFTVVAQAEDVTAPTVTAEITGSQDFDGYYLGSATVTLLAEDAGSGVASVEYALDGGAFKPYTAPITVDTVGEHTVTFRATDNAGNVSEVGSADLVVVEAGPAPDRTPPIASAEVRGEQDDEGAYIGTATVSISARDSGSGVALIEYAFSDEAFREFTAQIVVTEPGAHALRYRATDNAGNVTRTGTLRFSVAWTETDACPVSDERPTVIIGGVDSKVANVDTGNGCTIADLIDETWPWVSNGAFVAHVTEVTTPLVEDGTLTKKEQSRVIAAAKRSGIGG